MSYKHNNRAQEAIALEEESLEIRKKLYQNNNERWAKYYTTSLNNLAISYFNNGNPKKTLELFEEKLDVTKKIFGEEHESVKNIESDIAYVREKIG